MTTFTQHTIETAPDSARPFLEAAKNAYSFVPNLLGNMAAAPALLEGYMTLAGIFEKTDLSETERQIILMTNNRLNGCTYCMAAHTTISQMSKDEHEVDAFLAAGYSAQSVLEVILGTSLKVMSNYTNHIARTELDDAFAPNAWTDAAAQAA